MAEREIQFSSVPNELRGTAADDNMRGDRIHLGKRLEQGVEVDAYLELPQAQPQKSSTDALLERALLQRLAGQLPAMLTTPAQPPEYQAAAPLAPQEAAEYVPAYDEGFDHQYEPDTTHSNERRRHPALARIAGFTVGLCVMFPAYEWSRTNVWSNEEPTKVSLVKDGEWLINGVIGGITTAVDMLQERNDG